MDEESGCLSVDLGPDLSARLRSYAEGFGRSVDAVVADAVGEYLGVHSNHEQVRAAGLAAMREYEAELTEADARIDRLFSRTDDDQGDARDGSSV